MSDKHISTPIGQVFGPNSRLQEDFVETDQGQTKEIQDIIRGLNLRIDFSVIPDKMAFKIGEVADILGLKSYVLRFWETEFDVLRPKKSKSNQRVYERRDVQMALIIKALVHEERYSIDGARSALKKAKSEAKKMIELQKADNENRFYERELSYLLKEIRSARVRLVGN